MSLGSGSAYNARILLCVDDKPTLETMGRNATAFPSNASKTMKALNICVVDFYCSEGIVFSRLRTNTVVEHKRDCDENTTR